MHVRELGRKALAAFVTAHVRPIHSESECRSRRQRPAPRRGEPEESFGHPGSCSVWRRRDPLVVLALAVALLALVAAYFWLLSGRWPLGTRRDALTVGAVSVALMVAFEFGFGRWVDGTSWRELARDWNLADGRLWPLLVLWVGAGPTVFRELRRRRS